MMGIEPPDGAVPVHDATAVDLPGSTRGTITFEPSQSGTVFAIPAVAISKQADTTYQLRADGTVVYDQAPIPPTDVDNLAATFVPPREFSDSLEIVIRNVSGTTRTYSAQVIGYELPASEGSYGA